MSYVLTDLIRLPIMLCYSVFFSFYYFKWTFYSGILTMILLLTISYLLSNAGSEENKEMRKIKDEKMNVMTESINNIKTIKLDSYIPHFLKTIIESRDKEVSSMHRQWVTRLGHECIGHLGIPILMMVSFSTLIYHGFTISVGSTFAAV